ncbi:DUF2948 family protein [Thalassovita mediterranea]|jgi:hypothetical protein|uniref:DUF2948 domain-containing protein n=1 Tax=Thalassovita mediterranea TaxID=340021 RepID=A0A0P1H5J8_9RHOB|nr:DUF2948 family protein [Thalassovita mediterranea]MCG7574076.1 DUF2948 family protein [Phaeobacter sp. CNT1-3]CUH84760.1 hypothetical protein TM5383_01974 [Thalassovita mediterranea]SIS32501.1 Protein of unknown function [Thalassovita mediterranea]
MQDDARFEDGGEKPLNLGAFDGDDLKVLSALAQDAVFPISEMRWQAAERRFALLLNRFRWEDSGRDRHGAERVQSILVIENVQRVASQGIDRSDKEMILSLLSIDWQEGEDANGALELVLAGDGGIRLEVEALEVSLRDVTRPYRAPSGKAPEHDLS